MGEGKAEKGKGRLLKLIVLSLFVSGWPFHKGGTLLIKKKGEREGERERDREKHNVHCLYFHLIESSRY